MGRLTEVVIDNKNFPKVIIAGEENDLLCQYIMAGKNKIEANVYFDSDSFVTIELKEKNASSKAIIDLFSLRDVSKLIGFIDMTLSKKEGIITYSCDDFPKHVMAAIEKGGVYPTLCKDKMISDELISYTGKQPSLMKKIREGFLQKEKFKELQNDIEHNTVKVIYMDSEKAKEVYGVQEPYESCNEPSHVPASYLPEGWMWVQWDDGSGHLTSPNGEKCFEYDLCTIPGGVEYKESSKHRWSSFDGGFDEFKEYAESIVQSRCLSLEEKISSVSQKIDDNKAVEKDFRQESKSSSFERE